MKRHFNLFLLVALTLTATWNLAAEGKQDTSGSFEYRKLVDYTPAVALEDSAKTTMATLDYVAGNVPVVAYMPPAKEFNYYMAIGKGIEDICDSLGADYFMLAPESGADINGQMGMIQDAIVRDVDAIILSTHDEQAAAPLVKKATDKGIMVIIVNSDIRNFPTAVHAVVGYSQRKGTAKLGEYALENYGQSPIKLGLIEGMPGYHSTERIGGFVDVVGDVANVETVASLSGNWNVEGGNMAAMDIIQGHPEVNMLMAANDYEIMGAQKAVEGLGRDDIILLGNDGDTACLEEIAKGNIHATVNTTPFVMGQVAMQMVVDGLNGSFDGGFVEIPTIIVDKENVLDFLREPEKLYPKPSKAY